MPADEAIALEICASSIQSAINADEAGASRVELCSNLEQGGITPSYGTIKRALFRCKIPVYVLIRPRAGNFVYGPDEIRIMVEDIEICKQLGCHGIVVGVLTAANTVDIWQTRQLVTHAHPLPATFHRAFDDCHDRARALEDVIASGCTRILTSGGAETAEEGVKVLKELVQMASGRIRIMPGAGVSIANIAEIAELTGVADIHASAKVVSAPHEEDEASRFDVDIWETDREIVSSLLKELKNVETWREKERVSASTNTACGQDAS